MWLSAEADAESFAMFEKLEEIRRKYEEIRARLADPGFVRDHRAVRDAQKTLTELEPILSLIHI